MGLRIVVVGAGSSYTPELFADLTDGAPRLDVERVTLVDLDAERLAFIAGVCQRLLDGAGSDIRLATSIELEAAAEGADFILLQIRVGGLAARTRDEKLPMEFGMVGNETTGAGGFVCALRTVPVILGIARTIGRVAPQAWVLNLSNPAGIVTEALLRHTTLRVLGFCNIPTNTADALAKAFRADPARIRLDSFGLNHLSWVRRAYVDGEDRLQPLIDGTDSGDSPLVGLLPAPVNLDLVRVLRLLPAWYLRYFYFTERVLAEERAAGETKGERDMAAEARLRSIFTSTGYNDEARRILAGKGGADYYRNVLQVIDSIVHDRGDTVVIDVRNGRAMPDLPPEACVEVPARISADGAAPLPVGPMPLAVRGLVQAVKAYEELTIEAAVTGDRSVATKALVAHPLVTSYDTARPFLERVLENERPYLASFFGAGQAE